MFLALIIISILLIGVPVVASSLICVPKWWQDEVKPHMPKWMTSDTKTDISHWYWAPLRWFVYVFRFIFLIGFAVPLFFMIGLCIKYVYAWSVWIERKCPYTSVNVHHDYGSQRRSANRFSENFSDTFVGIWTLATSRFEK